MSIELEPKGKVFVGFLIVLGVLIFMSTRTSTIVLPESVYTGETVLPGSVEGFYRIPPQDAEQLITSNPSVVIVDCNTAGTSFLAGERLPNAIWSPDASVYYGQRMTLLLYSTPDDTAVDYARNLVGKMYGEIYVLTGGYQAWYNWINREQ